MSEFGKECKHLDDGAYAQRNSVFTPKPITLSEEAGSANKILITNSPAEALKDADYVVTDTWYVGECPKIT